MTWRPLIAGFSRNFKGSSTCAKKMTRGSKAVGSGQGRQGAEGHGRYSPQASRKWRTRRSLPCRQAKGRRRQPAPGHPVHHRHRHVAGLCDRGGGRLCCHPFDQSRRSARASSQLTSASAEILASTTQQAAGAQEQAAAVAQTVTTVDEVTQTADQAAQRAKSRRRVGPAHPGDRQGRPQGRRRFPGRHGVGQGAGRDDRARTSWRWPSRPRPSARSSPRSTTSPSRPTCWP